MIESSETPAQVESAIAHLFARVGERAFLELSINEIQHRVMAIINER
jgi:hypothetical protein